MKAELNIADAWSAGAGTDLGSLRVECVFCDEAGEPVKRRAVSVLSLLGSRRRARGRKPFADPQD